VVDGHATVEHGGAPIVVNEGQQWRNGDVSASTLPKTAVPGLAPVAVASARAPGPSVAEPLAQLDHAALLARAVQLRDERDRLLSERSTAQGGKSSSSHVDWGSSFYRYSKDDLMKAADEGRFTVRPAMDGKAPKIPAEVLQRLGITADQQAKLNDIYQRSGTRIRAGLLAIYLGLGGDGDVAASLSNTALVEEIMDKSSKGGDGWARKLARERAGLAPAAAANAGSPYEQAMRLFWHEEDMVFNDVDALLGPDVAQQALGAKGVSGNMWSSSSSSNE
jgi:hypothetical protein